MRRWQMFFFFFFFVFLYSKRSNYWWGQFNNRWTLVGTCLFSPWQISLSLILLNLKWLKHIKDVVFPQSEPNVYFIFEVTEQSYAQCSLLTFHRPHLYVFILASLISAFCKIVPASYSIMSQYQNQLIINKQKKKNQHILKKNCYN